MPSGFRGCVSYRCAIITVTVKKVADDFHHIGIEGKPLLLGLKGALEVVQ